MTERRAYGARQRGTNDLSAADRVLIAHASTAHETRVYLLRYRADCQQAQRLAAALARLVDHLWPLPSDATPAQRAAWGKGRGR